ncbi:MAG: hypothetical protein ACMZ64_09225 [Oleiphilus sp.]
MFAFVILKKAGIGALSMNETYVKQIAVGAAVSLAVLALVNRVPAVKKAVMGATA